MVKFDSVIRIKKPGYIYVYLTYENESNNYVYFDDLKVTYTKSQVVQSNNYYAFGLQTSQSWTRIDAKPNQYLYNGGSELNSTTNSYEMFFRDYDPAIARMSGVDPLADMYSGLSPYNYSANDPVFWNDPSGAEYEWASMGGCGCWRDEGPQDSGSNGGGMYGSSWYSATYGDGFARYGVGTHDDSPTYGEINARNWVRAYTGNQGFESGHTLTPYTTSPYLGEDGQLWGNDEGTLFGERGSATTGTLLWSSNSSGSFGKSLLDAAVATGGVIVDGLQLSLDIVGLIPVAGEIADGVNAGVYALRGDYVNAGLSVAAAIPIAGWAASGAKIGGKAITKFSGHGVNRAIQRGVKPSSILDALKSPLDAKAIKFDNLGRPSQRLIGKEAEVVYNPRLGSIISVNPTSTSKAKKLLNKLN